ncbi:DUF4150 domain-containing protein [Massilia sp. W12]|uniref:DUF4150 domain-containing protein n=1 Tax=Massilia sp. W12 TaxID=3126507 RepID=UPI0030D103D0
MGQHHVYANNMEICNKTSDGKVVANMPDVCMSPPGPAAGPIPIPYPNTAFATDLSNGSTTVFIQGKPAALKDISCFATSTGNEPATQNFQKGIVSNVIKGKAQFVDWSPNVKIESYNVCRHLDPMTQNHK